MTEVAVSLLSKPARQVGGTQAALRDDEVQLLGKRCAVFVHDLDGERFVEINLAKNWPISAHMGYLYAQDLNFETIRNYRRWRSLRPLAGDWYWFSY